MKITYTIGKPKEPNIALTIVTTDHRNSTSDLEEYLARYFSRHGGMEWSVKKE